MDKCLFCAIARGEIPSTRICESDGLIALLDIHPVRPGHTLIVPRDHYPYFDDMPEALVAEATILGQKLARAMKKLYGVKRVGFAFTGTDVAHVHAHVIPLVAPTDLTSRRYIVEEKLTFHLPPTPAADEMTTTAGALRAALGVPGDR